MSQVCARATSTLMPALVLASVLFLAQGGALADEPTSPPAASTTAEADQTQDKAAEVTTMSANMPDSVVATPAIHDSASTGAGAPPEPKEAAPAEHNENAAAGAPEKPPAVATPTVKHLEMGGPPKAVAPSVQPKSAGRLGTRVPKGHVGRGTLRSPRTSPRARTGATRAGSPRAGASRSGAGDGSAKGRPHTTTTQAIPPLPRGGTESDRVLREQYVTERYMSRTQRAVMLSKNTRAIKLFTSALEFQSDSRDAYHDRQFARAERLTVAARDFTERASRMVGPPREDPDYVELILKRTDDALERAKDVLRNGASRNDWDRLNGLKNNQKDAWDVFKDGGLGAAYKQTLSIREGVLALLRQLEDLPVPRDTAEKAIGGAQAALEQASKELGPKAGPEATRQVRLAGEYLTKARQSFSRGSYRSALLQAKVVERHVEHAVDAARSSQPGT